MLEIEFEYKDDMSKGNWNKQSCVVSSVAECKRIYGLGVDCDYRILSVKDLESKNEPWKRMFAGCVLSCFNDEIKKERRNNGY